MTQTTHEGHPWRRTQACGSAERRRERWPSRTASRGVSRQHRTRSRGRPTERALTRPPLIVAVLFGASHLVVGPVTAVAALLLGIAAGELRLSSASLLPAVIVHALFNLCGVFWPQA